MFKVGNKYSSTCWFTGGMHFYKCISRTESTVTFSTVYHEADGIHEIEPETFDIHTDEKGYEYILFYEYHGEENRMYAESDYIRNKDLYDSIFVNENS